MFIYLMKREKDLLIKVLDVFSCGSVRNAYRMNNPKLIRMYDPKLKKSVVSHNVFEERKNGIGDRLVKKLYSAILNGKMRHKKIWKQLKET